MKAYVELGWALVPIPTGTKGPNTKGWNLAENCHLPPGWTGNVGLAHAYSGTAALDLDRLNDAAKYLLCHGVDLSVLLTAPDAVRIDSGRQNKAKLLYKIPVPLRSLKLDKGSFELRCATADGLTVQDVLPPSIHPETGKPYQWVGDYTALPTIPPELLALWQRLAIANVRNQATFTEHEQPTILELRALLAKHSPNAPYEAEEGDSFLFTGMAISDATDNSEEGFALWEEFLRPGIKYEEGRRHLRTHWRSFKSGGGITWQWLKKGVELDASDFSALPPVDDISLEDDEQEPVDAAPPLPAAAPQTLDGWPVLRRKKNGRIEPVILNIHAAISHPDFCGYHIGYDQFRAELMQVPIDYLAQGWAPFLDHHYTELRLNLERRGFDATGVDNVRQSVASVGEKHRFDSAIDWLRAIEHDGKSRVAMFLHDYFGAEDTEYTRAVSLYLWTALAGRVLSPGCQADMAVIMVSKQGERKSTGISSLVPRPEQFVELNLDDSDDDLARKMAGCLVGELAELRGLATRDLEGIKSFITRKHEKWVPKYKEFANTYPRRLIFIGTTNKREFLADETGERRFLPVDVIQANPEAIQRDREQLWAEARDLYELAGIAWQRAETLGRQAVKAYKVSDSWEDTVALWLAAGADPDNLRAAEFTTASVATGALGIDIKHVNRGIEMRISKILAGLGYSKKQVRIDGVMSRFWKL